jgi:hypothetical protein
MDRTSFANGALHLLKCDRAEAYVRRFSTWRREEDISIRQHTVKTVNFKDYYSHLQCSSTESRSTILCQRVSIPSVVTYGQEERTCTTPALDGFFLSPQLPVARQYFMPSVMTLKSGRERVRER